MSMHAEELKVWIMGRILWMCPVAGALFFVADIVFVDNMFVLLKDVQ